MSDEKEVHAGADVIIGNPKVMPTDDKLKADAGSLCSQYLHFWNPGEVECTVILGRPDSKEVVYATSIQERDRLAHVLRAVHVESGIQKLLVQKHRLKR